MTMPLRLVARACGFAVSACVVVVAAQWLSLSFGLEPLVGGATVEQRTRDIAGPLREGPAMLAAVGVVAVGVICVLAWVLSSRHRSHDDSFRVGRRRDRVRVDRDSLAASLERRLAPIDRRVDATVRVTRRGRVHLRVVTPDPSPTGPTAEHVAALTDTLDTRHIPCRVGRVEIIDVRRLKSHHRVR